MQNNSLKPYTIYCRVKKKDGELEKCREVIGAYDALDAINCYQVKLKALIAGGIYNECSLKEVICGIHSDANNYTQAIKHAMEEKELNLQFSIRDN